jgi:hypothetical protein
MRFARTVVVVFFASALLLTPAAIAFQGPHTQFVPSTHDGLLIDVDLRWPDTGPPPAGGWPCVIVAHQGGADKNDALHVVPMAEALADLGYVTLAYSGRGDGASVTGGDPTDLTVYSRARDINDLIGWLINTMPTDVLPEVITIDPATIGMTGFSLGGLNTWYGGLLSAGVLTGNPLGPDVPVNQELAAIAPFGLALHSWANGFFHQFALAAILRLNVALWPILETYDIPALFASDPFSDVSGLIKHMTTPVLTMSALHDIAHNPNDILLDYKAAKNADGRRMYLGTGGHATSDNEFLYRRDVIYSWFDHWLNGAPLNIFGGNKIEFSLLNTLEKQGFNKYPPNDRRFTIMYLHSGQLLSTLPTDLSATDFFINDPSTSTFDPVNGFTAADAAANGFSDQIYNDFFPKETIEYLSDPLPNEVLLLGKPRARIWVNGTAIDRYQLNVHLEEVSPTGDVLLLSHDTFTVRKAKQPGIGQVSIQLSTTGRRVPAGHRLRLSITNLDAQATAVLVPTLRFIRYLPEFEPSTTSVFREAARPSAIMIPLIQGEIFDSSGGTGGVITSNIPEGFVRKGDSLQLTAPAGTNYRWKLNGSQLFNADNQSLTIDPVRLRDRGRYTVTFHDGVTGTVESSPFQL